LKYLLLQAHATRESSSSHALDAAFVERAEHFQAARTVFLRDQTLPVGFNFPMYLHRALYGFVLDLVEATPANWAVVSIQYVNASACNLFFVLNFFFFFFNDCLRRE